ncbi:MAG TPA: hypothetical protein DC038_09685 [Clostridiales bacterium]|nr:hypothetical protein [Clostridiales bacterium]
MYRGRYENNMHDKMYDIIELMYILNRLSNNSYIDDNSKQYLIRMLNDAESIKSNFDKYKDYEPEREEREIGYSRYNGYNYRNRGSFGDKIISFLKSLND